MRCRFRDRGRLIAAGLVLLLLSSCANSGGGAEPDRGAIDATSVTGDIAIQPDSSPSPSSWTRGKGGQQGDSLQNMNFGGKTRIFAVHVPSSYSEPRGVPLLLHFHGWRPLPAGVEDEIGYVWSKTADSNGFIAVAPEGLPCPELNPSDPYGCFKEAVDGPFVLALTGYLGERYNIDLTRVYLSGHSGGSFFVQGHGLGEAMRYAAAAEFSGGCIGSSSDYGNSCSVYDAIAKAAKRKLPMFVTHNPVDQIVPVQYSADLLKLLKANGHPTQAIDHYDGGKTGHSIDPTTTPVVWKWLAGFVRP